MALSLVPSPSRNGRPATKGGAGARAPTTSCGGNDTMGNLTCGALSGTMGASPFGILATTPELPLSTGTCPAPPQGLRSPAASRPGCIGLSLRRANSTSNNYMSRAVSGGVTPGTAMLSTGGRRVGVALRRLGAALVVLQLVLVCTLLARPAWIHSMAGFLRLSPSSFHARSAKLAAQAQDTLGQQQDESSTVFIVSKLAADSRRTPAASATASRRERMWPTRADIDEQQKQAQQKKVAAAEMPTKPSTTAAQPVRILSGANAGPSVTKAATGVDVAATNAERPTSLADKKAAATAAIAVAAVTSKAQPFFPPFVKPVVPYAGRVAHPPPIVGVVFYGRRDRVRILDCYLQRNMVRNGGLLTSVVFVTATWQTEDVQFLERLLALRAGDYSKVYPQRLDKGYTGHYAWMDPATMYVKIDDDVVYFADAAIDHMLAAHNLNRYHLISANVINHQPLELPHSQRGAHTVYEQTRPGDKSSWQPLMQPAVAPATTGAGATGAGGAASKPVAFMDNGWDVWGDWRRAANVHYSFLANHAAGRLGLYEFPPNEQLWNFNTHFGYTRWRINMIMFKGSTIDVHVYNMSSTVGTYPGDDEDYITRILPQQLNRTSAAVSQALAVHFSFYMQRAGLENSTDLLDRYALLAERTCGTLVSA